MGEEETVAFLTFVHEPQTCDFIHPPVSLCLSPVRGSRREEAKCQSSSVVSGGRRSGTGHPCQTRAHKPAECKSPTLHMSGDTS